MATTRATPLATATSVAGGKRRAAASAPVPARRPIGEGRRTLAPFLAFLGFYLLTASNHFYTGDEETLFRMVESVVERQTFALPQGPEIDWALHAGHGPDGQLYSHYAPLQPLLALPVYLLGKLIAAPFPAWTHDFFVRAVVGIIGPLVAAAMVALLYRFARALGYGGGPALGLAAIYGLATLAWPYSRTFFAEPLTALFLLLALFRAEGGTRTPPAALPENAASWPDEGGAQRRTPATLPRALIVSGSALGAALATKPHAMIAVPALGLYLLARLLPHRRLWRHRCGAPVRRYRARPPGPPRPSAQAEAASRFAAASHRRCWQCLA